MTLASGPHSKTVLLSGLNGSLFNFESQPIWQRRMSNLSHKILAASRDYKIAPDGRGQRPISPNILEVQACVGWFGNFEEDVNAGESRMKASMSRLPPAGSVAQPARER